MARPRERKAAGGDDPRLLAEIREYYEGRLKSRPAALPGAGGAFPAVAHGPVWAVREGSWLLPEHTAGWDVVCWASAHLAGPGGGPFLFTDEQLRFMLWYYATDSSGKFLSPTVVLQRCKGWGKDPLAGVIALAALCGPSVPFVGEDGVVRGRREESPWIRLLAVSQQQTENTMGAIRALAPPDVREDLAIRVVTTLVRPTDGSAGFITAITSNPDAAEGARATLTVCNETQNWTRSNSGTAMMGVVRGDAAKSPPERQARVLHICNAARVGVESVGLSVREGWEEHGGKDAGLMYDSLEAPPDAPLTAEAAPEVVESVRGDASWLTPDRIVQDIMDPSTPPSESRRKWYNQVTAAEDAWLSREEWDSCLDRDLPALEPGDEVAMFFDGGKSDDSTACVAVRVSDGAPFVVGVWQRPPDARAHNWVVDRAAVDGRVRDFYEHHNVVALWADPSHAKEDESMEQFWDSVVDGWHRDYGGRLRLKAGPGHSVKWDMSSPVNQKAFVHAVQAVTTDVVEHAFVHDGDARLRAHVLHAVRYPTKFGVSISKDGRESRKKIDLAVCMIGGRMIRNIWLNSRRRSRGSIW